ncbi:MAG: NB-ARC domain-containing protein [Oscillatoriaceae cyanobacterium Prado104]|jgi:WD40 repeat protein|nr:NB-ARC domain-containing protein [Oscillatoriaceae cyanobacterium Prado104]
MTTLKASPQGLALIKQARCAKGWATSDFRWMEAASEILGVSWVEDGVFAIGISEGTWKRFLAGKYPINAEAFKAYCQVLELNWEEIVGQSSEAVTPCLDEVQLNSNSELICDRVAVTPTLPILLKADWSEAPDVSVFYGRKVELDTVKQWVVREKCRLVTLLGMGGIGKTALSVKLAKEIVEIDDNSHSQIPNLKSQIDCIIWRSLRNAPTVEEILAEVIFFLSQQQEINLPTNLEGRISRLLHYLRTSRCLLILDNAESILQAGDRTGKYRTGYEGYGQLLRCIAETPHQSCLIVTSREKPQGLAAFEGETLPVRSLQLSGLPSGDGRELFNVKGTFTATESQWQTLISRYAGNPLALKIVASSIHDYFDNNISYFLDTTQQSAFLFDDIRDLLEQQFLRLTELERAIVYWLAIDREPVTLPELQADFVAAIPPRDFLESLNSLQRRSLIEKINTSFTQQPVVMEYVTTQLIEQVCEEIGGGEIGHGVSGMGHRVGEKGQILPDSLLSISLFINYALLKATAKDYIRETQANLILQPIIDRLTTTLGSPDNMFDRLSQILNSLRGKTPKVTGYAAGNAINLLHQAGVDLTELDCSQLTVWQAYLQGVTLHNVDFTNSDLSRCTFTETLGNILWAAFSPDGQLLATCDTDCNVRIWEVKSGKLLQICRGHTNWVRFVVFSPDGKTLASCGADCTVKLWNLQDGVCIKTFVGHEHEVFAIAYSPDGKLLASGSGDRTVKLWDIRDGNCLNTLTGHTDWVRSVAFSPDGKTLASGGADRAIKLWNLAETENTSLIENLRSKIENPKSPIENPKSPIENQKSKIENPKSPIENQKSKIENPKSPIENQKSKIENPITLAEHSGWVRSVIFSPDGEVLASASSDRTIKLWDYQTGECLRTYTGHQGSVYSIAFSPTGDLIVSGSGDRTVKFWDCYSDNCIKTLYGQTNEVCCVAFNPDDRTIACVSLDQTMRLWDYQSGECLKSWYGNTDWALPVSFSPISSTITKENAGAIGGILASGSNDKTVKLWDWQTGDLIRSLAGHTDFIYALNFSADGQILASGSTDSTVRLWQVNTGQCCQILQGHADWVFAVAFQPPFNSPLSKGAQREILVSGSADCTLKLWNCQTGQCLKTLTGHTDKIFGIDFSSDGQIIASASADRTIRLWDFATGDCITVLDGHTNRVYSVAFSPDGNTLASASTDRTIKLWDWATEACLKTFIGHTNWVFSVAFSKDGQTLASASHDGTVRRWDVKSGQCIGVYEGHSHLVSSVAFSPDGEAIASGSQDQTVRIWNAKTGECARILIAKRLYEGMRLTGVKGLTEATIATLQTLGAIVK